MSQEFDIVGIGNAIVDVITDVNDEFINQQELRKGLMSLVDLDTIKSQGYSFQIEMNFRAWVLNAKIKECPIIFVDRTIGESKMSKSIMFEAIWVVWRLRVLKIFKWF